MRTARCRVLAPLAIGLCIGLAFGCAQPPKAGPKAVDPAARERVIASYRAFLDAAKRKDKAAAITSGRTAVKSARAVFGPTDRETAAMELNLALVLDGVPGAEKERAELLERAIGTLRGAGSSDSPELIRPYLDLARLRMGKHDYEAARQSYQMALQALEALQPGDPERLAKTLLEASEVEDLDEKAEASDLLRQRAGEIARARVEQDSRTSALVIQRLARHALVRRRYEPAKALYLEALALLERPNGDVGQRARAHSQLGTLYEELGDAAQASEQRRIAAALNPVSEIQPSVRVEPEYPRPAKRKRMEGAVVVALQVDAEGKVTDAFVLDSDPPTVFDEAAVQAVKKWSYEPASVDGKPVARRALQVLLRFRLPR